MMRLQKELKIYGTSAIANDLLESPMDNKKRTIQLKSATAIKNFMKGDQIEHYYVINQDGKFKSIWNFLIAMLLLYTAIVLPIELAFIDGKTYDVWWWINVWINAIFFSDVIINCFTTYTDSNGTVIKSRKKIFMRYLKSWLLLDIAACFPFDFVETDSGSSSSTSKYNGLARLARLPRLSRLIRISRMFKVVTNYNKFEFVEKVQNFFNIKRTALRLLMFSITVLLCVHVISCLWYWSAKMQGFPPDCWVVKSGYMDLTSESLYLTSMYWAFTTLSTVGYGDIHPWNDLEVLICMVWMMFGLCFFSFTIGSLSSMLSSLDTREIVLNNKLTIIDEFAKETKLKKVLRLRLRHALKYSTESAGFSWSDKLNIFNELPRELKYEVALSMHQGAIKHLPFFMEKDKVFVASVVPFLQHLFLKHKEIIFTEGEYADEIYFLYKGTVNYVMGPEKVSYKKLQEGSYFGDIEVIEVILRKYTVVAKTDVHLLTMSKSVVSYILEEFPTISKDMREIAYKRDKINQLAKEEFAEYLRLKETKEIEGKDLKEVKDMIRDIVDKRKNTKEMLSPKEKEEIKFSEVVNKMDENNFMLTKMEGKLQSICEISNEILEFMRKDPKKGLPKLKVPKKLKGLAEERDKTERSFKFDMNTLEFKPVE
ncbi:unnamed protein product [Blepharisma stoltei]|uniref:Cyclic nucleotide-binding domain-containing protein n=1 Tax=Blepharisma stoltei TaxID=1481888 RepID=A0AAU9IQB2_9CILI|nr:unnamed protein product [Blepharisma stoltei]